MKTHTHRGLSPASTHTLLILLTLCLTAQALVLHVPEGSLHAVVQGSVLLPADVSSLGLPLVSWRVATATGVHPIVTWQPGVPPNVSSGYERRVEMHTNGSLTLTQLRLHDTGYYVVTVTESSGNSKEAGLLLQVTEVRYEDLQYLGVVLLVLLAVSGSLMVSMWLLERLYRHLMSRQRKRHSPDLQVELQPLEATPNSTLFP
ncbi:V-set and transmembrane domain-containing protein 5 [Alosa sapidissima]|uniref:V-set and transmembrane domain-containing protein 5 n=1 Tax=Alosa sapidissima TaxID=34773 RepID=UPI001C0A1571|nr:V-set and transmembrane domain-containing protein 5 [Alosa sapidissima]XP_041919452.1 V-set and transmembrane domain-containing protein 5 [Alosa sapidissima]